MTYSRILPFLGCCAAFAFAGCGKKSDNTASDSGPMVKLEACQLLTNQEIEAVQGSPIRDTKSSEQVNGRVRTSQCYFSAEESNRSVSLSLTQANPAGSDRLGAKASWEETFGRYENEGDKEKSEADKEKSESLREQKGEKGEEEEATPPKKITGIGDEAFWTGNRVGGALYALKKNVYIRISLGGPDPENVRIEKSKTLAQKAIDRL